MNCLVVPGLSLIFPDKQVKGDVCPFLGGYKCTAVAIETVVAAEREESGKTSTIVCAAFISAQEIELPFAEIRFRSNSFYVQLQKLNLAVGR